MKRAPERMLLAVGFSAAIVIAIIPLFLVPRFVEGFNKFGVNLPPQTYLLANYYGVFSILPALVITAWLFWPTRDNRGVAACAIGLGGFVLIFSLILSTFFSTILRLAETM